MLDETTRNRLRLWLRSERALGLSLVGPGEFAAGLVDVLETPANAHPAVQKPHAPRATMGSIPAIAPLGVEHAPSAVVGPTVQLGKSQSEPFTSPILSSDERRAQLSVINQNEVMACVKCQLSQTRNHTVFGEGDVAAQLMFIGEGPGAKEDQSGRPFVGPAGELLTRMIGAMGLQREQVYIANIVKCRAFSPGPPPRDRAPAPEEVAACSSYIERQVEIIRPRVIVTLGVPATQFVLQTKSSMSRLRGQWNTWHGIQVMPTWHPSYLLRREKEGDLEPKRQAWSDLQMVMKELGLGAAKK